MADAPPGNGTPADRRRSALTRLGTETFDLLVVGGGITGAAVAEAAASKGYHVALVEREDFGSGTSGASSKMLHGGLRYLQHGQVSLVKEALYERGSVVRELGPDRAIITPFLLPLRGSWSRRTSLRFGTWLYQRLSGGLSLGPRVVLGSRQVLAKVPSLSQEGLRGGILYDEGVVDDVLLTLDRVLRAREAGATVLNHVEAHALKVNQGRACGVDARDRLTGATFEIRARQVVNAAGVWGPGWAGAGRTATLRPTKGVHIVVRRERAPLACAVVLPTADGRWVFALPYGSLTILGTTDTDYPGPPDGVRPEAADVRYLLDVARKELPGLALGPGDVVDVYAGLRPLLGGGALRPGDLSREDVVHRDASGLLTVAGGKLTTHGAMARRALDQIASDLGPPPGPRSVPSTHVAFPTAVSHGKPSAGAEAILSLEKTPVSGWEAILAPLISEAIDRTGAATLPDLLDRRFHALSKADPTYPAVVRAVTTLAAGTMGWGPDQAARQRSDYLERLAWVQEGLRAVQAGKP